MLLLVVRLAYLQIYRGEELALRATAQRMRPQTIDAQRGRILDRNYKTLAVSVGADAVYALPESIRDVVGTARQLAPYLSVSEEELRKLLSSKSTSVWLARGLTVETAEAIRKLGLPGIRIVQRPQRYYPQGSLAAHVVGIAGTDNQGLEGIEYFYEEILRGRPGQQATERDAAQRSIPGGETQFVPPEPGHDVVLTIDTVIQYIAETRIQQAVISSKSERGLVLAMNPKTGEILANAIYPTFDPNYYQEVSAERRRNVAVTDQYEPGSTFKFVTAAAALDLGITDYNRTFESGVAWEVGGGKVRNLNGQSFGSLTFREAIERSDNITFAKLSVEMGPQSFHRYIQSFGFGRRLGVDFPGEIAGTVLSPNRTGATLQWANTGFGQGIAVTPLQLLSAMSAVANGGSLMKPYFVKEILDAHGKLVQKSQPEVLDTPVDTETARAVSELLRSVVANGNGNRADIPGYHVAGKTGTAEVPEGGAYGNDIIASFVGFAPVDDPALAILVVLYKPKVESAYGGVLAAPVFKEIMEESLEYLGIKRREEVRRRSSLTSVPNVINLSRQEAQARLAQDGLFWTMEGEGTLVTDQTPRPGVQVPAQTTVHLYFDLGEPEDVEVPSVLGLSMFDASAKLSAAGLRVRVVGSGVAAQQSPGAGARVPKGSLVEVRFEL
ncbi:MAG: penicillin-binding transpeptidase domain-containing protein [Limnochordia bacterium]|jgi:stage V sporulation protein D (sporulation-specific penicillin-binding protein)|nr:penicillin-binding transpeptidase domain-containing protein [Bacillota bacterium]NLL08221.1 PASTA domain-containing protein [Bacillota bacterium]HBG08484.1 stage V sporulation protein D [Bacillota bacterium]